MFCALESSRKDLSFDTTFVSVAPLFTEYRQGAKTPPRTAVVGIIPGPGRVKELLKETVHLRKICIFELVSKMILV